MHERINPQRDTIKRNGTAVRIRGMVISTPLLLAPMAGITHSAFRAVLARLGGVGLFATEMLSARTLPREDPDSPFLVRTPQEAPLSWQILVGKAEEIPPALDALHALGADAVDINMGCPAPNVRRRLGGSTLLQDPVRARLILREVRSRTELPVSVKMRIFPAGAKEAEQAFCRMLQEEGVDFLSVHARFPGEPFGRPPRWERVRYLKEALTIPVFLNGGVFSVEDARKALDVSGADGLMIGRGAVIRPWLMRDIARDVYGLSLPSDTPSRKDLFHSLAQGLTERFPPELRLGRLKRFTHYFSRTFLFAHTLASAVQASRTFEEACERADAFFASQDPDTADLLKTSGAYGINFDVGA
ncbi:MAG: tRNA-dihydrouridine synthase family protein [Deltaproteobacteria bacterium]